MIKGAIKGKGLGGHSVTVTPPMMASNETRTPKFGLQIQFGRRLVMMTLDSKVLRRLSCYSQPKREYSVCERNTHTELHECLQSSILPLLLLNKVKCVLQGIHL